jgi:uncharacterized integral membrane protein
MDDTENRDKRTDPADLEEPRSIGAQIRLWGGLIAGALLVLFLLQNLQRVEVNFLWFEWHARMVVALLAAALLGATTTMLIGFIRRRSQAAATRTRAEEQLARERAKKR